MISVLSTFVFYVVPHVSGDVKLPVVLIVHSPSRASHLKSVIALTEYLKNHCYIEALLDQLDVQSTKSKVTVYHRDERMCKGEKTDNFINISR